mgnify:CR=1 FL=1
MEVSSSDIMMAEDSAAQKKALEERAAKLRDAVLDATGSSDTQLTAKIDRVQRSSASAWRCASGSVRRSRARRTT